MATATTMQLRPLERAVERATLQGRESSGSGQLRDGSRFWSVASRSHPGVSHVVSMAGKRLLCICTGRTICALIGVMLMHIAYSAAKRQRLADEVEAALEEEPITASAFAPPSLDAPNLLDNSDPIRIFNR